MSAFYFQTALRNLFILICTVVYFDDIYFTQFEFSLCNDTADQLTHWSPLFLFKVPEGSITGMDVHVLEMFFIIQSE